MSTHENDQDCPKCGDECWRNEVDVGLGIIYGPWGCSSCGWSEHPDYDRSDGREPAAPDGWRVTPQGALVNIAREREETLEAISTVEARFGLDLSRAKAKVQEGQKVLTWLCPNAMTGIGGRKHDATAERTAPGEWRIRCSCGYQARASSGEVGEAERRARVVQ